MERTIHLADFTLTMGLFGSTEFSVVANTDAGRSFLVTKLGFGAVGCTLTKSHGPAFEDAVLDAGLTLEVL